MASSNLEETSPLKEELQKLVLEIIGFNQEDEDDNESDHVVTTIDKAIETLTSLKELNLKNRNGSSLSSVYGHFDVPLEFRCPMSKEIMNDPVVLGSEQTYDRPFIEKWLKDIHQTCPQTRQVLGHVVLTPNNLVRELIKQWCKDRNMQTRTPAQVVEDKVLAEPNFDRDHLKRLLIKMSTSTLSDQKQAANEIRLLTNSTPSVWSFLVESVDIITQLLGPLTQSGNIDKHPDLQEDIVTVLLSISLVFEENQKIIGEHPLVIPLLVESLTVGNMKTRSNAAATLFSLSLLDSNKVRIGEAALKPLIELLDGGEDHPSVLRDAAATIYELCKVGQNGRRAISGGVIRVILRNIKDGTLKNGMDDIALFSILPMLAKYRAGIDQLMKFGAVRCLLGVIREGSIALNEESCVVTLHLMCNKNQDVIGAVRYDEKKHGTISRLGDHGTEKAKREARSLLDMLRGGTNVASTS